MTEVDAEITEDEVTEEELIELGDMLDDGAFVPLPARHERITQNEDESHEDFLARRRLTNKLIRMIENRQKGYRQATRLVAGGLRNKMQDLYANRETKLAPGEKAKRREANRTARKSRKVNGQR